MPRRDRAWVLEWKVAAPHLDPLLVKDGDKGESALAVASAALDRKRRPTLRAPAKIEGAVFEFLQAHPDQRRSSS